MIKLSKSLLTLAKFSTKYKLPNVPTYRFNLRWFSESFNNLNSKSAEIDAIKKKVGEDNPEVVGALNSIGISYYQKGQLQESIKFFEESIKIIKQISNDEPAPIADIYNNIGLAHHELGELEDAINYYEKAIEVTKKFEESSPQLASTLINLGAAYYDNNQLDEAIQSYEEALEIAEKTYGENHISCSEILHNLGLAYKTAGKAEESEKAFGRAFDALKQYLDTIGESAETAKERAEILNKGGSLLENLNRFVEALEWYRQSVDCLKKYDQKDDFLLSKILSNLGYAAYRLGDYEDAAEFLKKSIDLKVAVFGEDNPNLIGLIVDYGELLQSRGRWEEAAANFYKALTLQTKYYGRQNLFGSEIMLRIGLCNYNLKKYQDAEKMFEDCIKEMETIVADKGNISYITAKFNLSMTKEQLGKRDEAEKHAKEALKLAESVYEPNHPELETIRNQVKTFEK